LFARHPGKAGRRLYGVIEPLKTPQPIEDRLNKEIVDILRQPDVASRLAADGSEPVGSTAQ
jgi:tripartite-type tricarboxylate transporter receptor subunit TctC